MTKHKWHDEIVAWADGAEIEFKSASLVWEKATYPQWDEFHLYRIKPQPKQPKYLYAVSCVDSNGVWFSKDKNLLEHEFIIGKIEVQDD
jgi:hypothetical protein